MTEATGLDALLASYPQLNEHTVAPPALGPFPGMAEALARVDAFCRAGTAGAAGLSALGNILVREGRYLDAFEAYACASETDPADAAAHWACAELAHILRDETASRAHRAAALALQRVYPDPAELGSRTPVVLLLRDAPYSANAPLELLLDRRQFAVHKYYVEGAPERALPPHAAQIVAFGYASDGLRAIDAALALAPAAPRLNDAARLERTARDRLAAVLAGIAGVQTVPYTFVPARAAPAIALPALVRPIDTHAGDGFALIGDARSLAEHLDRFPAPAYGIAPYVDYRSDDGLFRKYRIIFVKGRAFPYHAAIAPRWMVHYQSSPMREHEWMRMEEAAFLHDPAGVFAHWSEATDAIARAIGLEYFGIDVARLPDGGMLVFEADAAMLVHDEDEHDVFAYKRPFVARIRDALAAALRG
jgi:hypothetical protein